MLFFFFKLKLFFTKQTNDVLDVLTEKITVLNSKCSRTKTVTENRIKNVNVAKISSYITNLFAFKQTSP